MFINLIVACGINYEKPDGMNRYRKTSFAVRQRNLKKEK